MQELIDTNLRNRNPHFKWCGTEEALISWHEIAHAL